MLQQINFYNLLPKKSGFQLSRQWVLSIYSVFVLLLIFIYGVELRQKQHLLPQYTLLHNQMSVLQQQLLSLTQQYPVSDAIILKNTVHELQQKLLSKSKMLNLLTSKINFSAYLLGFAAVNVQGIWLTEIVFNNAEQKIDLKGFALQSELIEKLLDQLSKETAFSTVKFEVQNITENPRPPSFEISARAEVTA